MKTLLALLCFTLAMAARAQGPDSLHITTEYSPPSSMMQDGAVIGSATERVREIMARTGIRYSIELLPWKRAYATALARQDGCVFAASRTPERERLFKWVGPLDESQWVLMGRAGRNYKLSTLEDARKLRIGTYNGDAREEFLRQRGFQVDSAHNDMTNPEKLLLGRIDLWAAGLRRGSTLLARHGWAGKIVPVLVFQRVQVYLACNAALPDALVERMNRALDAMAKDGSTRRIDARYEHWMETGE